LDSKDNLYANDGNLIYKITVTADNKAIAKICAGQQYTYKLEDGPIATAGFNMIDLMTIDKNDNIYLTDSYDKIKAAIGSRAFISSALITRLFLLLKLLLGSGATALGSVN
jgi:hypothetical protein